jgi:hypothetical protein
MTSKKCTNGSAFKSEQSLLGLRISSRLQQALDGLEAQEKFIKDMEDTETPSGFDNPPYK